MNGKHDLGFEFAHIGINCENEAEAEAAAKFFCAIFGFDSLPTPTAIFCGCGIEVMKFRNYGRLGHIAISTPHMDRAVEYLKSRGIAMNEASAKSDGDGLIAIYLEQEVAGFAVHLLRSR